MKGDPLRSQNHDELKSSTVGPNLPYDFWKSKIFKIFGSLQFFLALQYIKNWTKVVPGQNFFVPEKKKCLSKKTSFEILWSGVWKGGFQSMLILSLLGMYFDAAVVFLTNSYSYLSNKRTCPFILFKKKVQPTLWFSFSRLKIPPYPLVLRVGWIFYPTRLL